VLLQHEGGHGFEHRVFEAAAALARTAADHRCEDGRRD
jgi:hypothetical protein